MHLARAVETIAAWEPPMRFNDTTRNYFEKLANVSAPEEAARYKGLFDPAKARRFANTWPRMIPALTRCCTPRFRRTSSGRLPGERDSVGGGGDAGHSRAAGRKHRAFYEMMRKVINDPAIEVVPETRNQRPGAAPSRIDSDAYHADRSGI